MSDDTDAYEHLEHAEHAAQAARAGGPAAAAIPLSITVMAVLAAVFGSMETTSASRAVLARSDAAIRQGEASDLWGFYQARSIKKNMYEIAAAQAENEAAKALKAQADHYASEEAEIQTNARAKEKEVRKQEEISEAAMERHHSLTIAVNIIHLAIALASISIVMRRRWLWYGSIGVMALGFAAAFI